MPRINRQKVRIKGLGKRDECQVRNKAEASIKSFPLYVACRSTDKVHISAEIKRTVDYICTRPNHEV